MIFEIIFITIVIIVIFVIIIDNTIQGKKTVLRNRVS